MKPQKTYHFTNISLDFRIGPSLRSGPEFCPRVNATAIGSPEILVSAGLPKSVRVKVIFNHY